MNIEVNNQVPQISFEDTEVAFSAKSNYELKRMYWLFTMMNRSFLVDTGTFLIKQSLYWRFPITWLIRPTLFEHFCGGETIEDCEKSVSELYDYGIQTILDYSIEGEKTEEGFEHTTAETLRTIKNASENPDKFPFAVFKVTGLADFELLVKVQTGKELSSLEKEAWGKVKERVNEICKTAFETKVKILIDAEETWIQEVIDSLAYEMMRKYNKEQAIVYNTYQIYTKAGLPNLKKAYQIATEEGLFLGAKIVRGAYMEKERERAKEKGYTDPIQVSKKATDRDFDEALVFCIEHLDKIAFMAGTHNEQSSYYLIKLMQKHQIERNDPKVYFAQLYGMSDHISYNLSKTGYNVAKYLPYGPIKKVLPYLFRRAEENTSVAGQTSRELSLIRKEIKRRKNAKSK